MTSTLRNGETLQKTEALTSSNGKYKFYIGHGSGAGRIYRFEVGRDPIVMRSFDCRDRNNRDGFATVSSAHFCGGRPTFPPIPDPHGRHGFRFRFPLGSAHFMNAKLVMSDNGDLILFHVLRSGAQGSALWRSGTGGNHPRAVNPSHDIALVTAGALSINADTIIENTFAEPINVCDGETAAVLAPGETIGAREGVPGTLAIQFQFVAFDLEGAGSAVRPLTHQTSREGNIVRLVPGTDAEAKTEFRWENIADNNFSYLPSFLDFVDDSATNDVGLDES